MHCTSQCSCESVSGVCLDWAGAHRALLDRASVLLVQAICNCCSSGLIDDSHDVQSRNYSCILGGLQRTLNIKSMPGTRLLVWMQGQIAMASHTTVSVERMKCGKLRLQEDRGASLQSLYVAHGGVSMSPIGLLEGSIQVCAGSRC